jgi:hypothetical protein
MNIIKEVKTLELPLGTYVVIGSSTLAIRGIRPAQDIDIIVTQDIYDRFKASGWKEQCFPGEERPCVLLYGLFDVGTSWSVRSYHPTFEQLFNDADIIEGVPFASLKDVLQWKKTCGRDKDLEDVELIEAYLKQAGK